MKFFKIEKFILICYDQQMQAIRDSSSLQAQNTLDFHDYAFNH